jgi:hypothetical protein
MARYAGGKYALGISDRSGRAYHLSNMIREWNGNLVGKDEYEAKQPQLVLLPFNAFKSGASGSAVITVTEPGHGRSTGDTVRFRDVEAFDGFTEAVLEVAAGRSITKIDDNRYSFTASSGTATTGNVTGGGGFASAGPVTLSA